MKQEPDDFTVFRDWHNEGWGVYGSGLGATVLRFPSQEEAEAKGRELASANQVGLWLQLTPRHEDATLLCMRPPRNA